MMRVAITGGIGSGKSFVCRLLEKRGIKVYDCDSEAKRIMMSSADVRERLTRLVGKQTYIDGKLNKAVLTQYLLSSADNANKINGIVHPAVAADFIASGYSWMECALLFSSGFNRYVDRVICVSAPYEVRVQRIMQRDNITQDKASAWIDCQMPQEEVASLSDFVIVNDGAKQVEPQIEQILKNLFNN